MKKTLLAMPLMLALGAGTSWAQTPTYPPTGTAKDLSTTSQSKGSPSGSGHDRTGAPSTNMPDSGSKRDIRAAESAKKARDSHKRVKPSMHDKTGAETTPASGTVPGAAPTRARDVRTGVVDKSAEPQSKGSPSGSGHDRDMTGTVPPSGPAGQGR